MVATQTILRYVAMGHLQIYKQGALAKVCLLVRPSKGGHYKTMSKAY